MNVESHHIRENLSTRKFLVLQYQFDMGDTWYFLDNGRFTMNIPTPGVLIFSLAKWDLINLNI